MLNLTTEEFARINSKATLSLYKALEGFSCEQAEELVDPENLKRAFQIILGCDGEADENEPEFQKFLEDRNFEIFKDLEQAGPVPVAKTQFISLGNEWVVGDEVRAKLEELKVLGGGWRQAFSDFHHTDEIPEEDWDKVRVYTETILRRRGSGLLGVLVLGRDAFTGEWRLRVRWLVGDFLSYARAVGRLCE